MGCKGKSDFLARQRAERQAYIEASERVTRQLMVDCMMLVLNDEFGFGYDRIKRVMNAMEEKYNLYHDALDGGPEADYFQEKLDEAISRIMRDREKFYPFRERYPEIKEITYGGKRGK